jgi:sarcosine oxidase, subunit beta
MADVAVVGAGVAGLCIAAELAGHGLSVTVVERRYPGGGNTTRNVGRVRRVQLTAELTALAVRAHDKWHRIERLTGGRNALVYPTRYAWVLYDDDERDRLATLEPMWRDLDARAGIVDAAAALRAVPVLAGGERPVGAVLGEAAIVHHDAALAGLIQACRDAGVELRTGVRVVGLELAAGRVAGLRTSEGIIAATTVVNAAGAEAGAVGAACGVALALTPVRREALVCQPSRPFMSPAVTFYRPQEGWFNQTLRGELVAGSIDPDEPEGFREDATFRFLSRTAALLLRKAPRLGGLHVIRQWAGAYELTPDRAPLIGAHDAVSGLYTLGGWSGRGLLLAPIAAELAAREIAGLGRDPVLAPFHPDRFAGASPTPEPSGDYYARYLGPGRAP